MNRIFTLMLSAVILSGALGTDSMAQSKADDPFRFSINVSGEFTDNRDSTPDSTSTFDYHIGPNFMFTGKPGDASSLVLNYNPVYRYRTKPSWSQNSSELYHNANFAFRKRSSDITEIRVIDNFNYTDDPEVVNGGTLYRRDSSFIYNMIEAGMYRIVRSADSLDVAATFGFKKYDNNAVADQSDEQRYALKTLYLRQYQRNSAVAFDVQVAGQGYKKIAGIDRGYNTVIGAIGMEHIANPSLRMGGRIGGQVVSYNDSSLGSEVAPAVNLAITGSTIPTVKLTGAVDHRIRESDVFPFASQKATDLSANLEVDLKERNIVLRGGVTYHIGQYSRDALPAGVATSTGDETAVIVEGGMTYKYNNETQFGLLLRSEDVDSDADLAAGRNFTRNSVSVSAIRQF